MQRIAFATSKSFPNATPDDQAVAKLLSERGINVEIKQWESSDVSWSNFDAVVIRSTWNYHCFPDEFADWIGALRDLGVALFNPANAVLWNLQKSYLSDLKKRGISIIPTLQFDVAEEICLEKLMHDHGWKSIVIKPIVGAMGYET